ncbi:MAG: alpha/beta hydrolase [Clostridiales bacterium]|nr:alpha/beta hydrolase [Clostridiales bacterium]
MSVIRKDYSFPSVSGLCNIYAQSFIPDDAGSIKAIVQIAHGMAEYSDRYSDFAAFLAGNGFAVFLNDHLGHGKSVSSQEELGFFGEKDGWRNFILDAHQLTDIARKELPDKPVIFFGHSMGSFVARSYVKDYGNELAGAVFCGTSGANPGASIGAFLARSIAKRNGTHFRSEFINSLAFGSYNKKIKPERTPFDWLTREDEIVDKYVADPLCGFLFTASGYNDMFTLLDSVSKKSWYASVPYVLPILIISGACDPVGNYGKGVTEVYKTLRSTGHGNTKLKLYENCRHEILNETNRNEVYADVADWINGLLTPTERNGNDNG